MHKKKINRKYLFTVMFLMLSSGLFCGCSSKKKELVWYISEPESYGIENAVAYEEIEAERFQCMIMWQTETVSYSLTMKIKLLT